MATMEIKQVSGLPTSTTSAVPGTEQLVDQSFGAARTSLRPLEYAGGGLLLGQYSATFRTGAATVIAAAGAIFSARWAVTNAYMVPLRIRVAGAVTTVFTTAQVVDLDAIVVRGFTAADTGGTTITLGVGNKMRKTMGDSLVTDMRIATTAALGAGTKVADANALGIAPLAGLLTATTPGSMSPFVDLWKADAKEQHPLVLSANEGINVRLATTMGAAGVMNFYVAMDWAEVPFY